MQQGGTLCNRVGHNNMLIEAVCMKKECQEPIPCCRQCISEEHSNHQNNDFVEIQVLQGQAESSLEYLTQLAQASQQICQMGEIWNKKILKLIDQLRQQRHLGQNPTVTDLCSYAKSIREGIEPQKETELVQNFKTLQQKIQESLKKLYKDTTELVKYEVESDNQLKQEMLDLDQLHFDLIQQRRGDNSEVCYVSISNDDKYLATSLSPYNERWGPTYFVILFDLKKNEQLIHFYSSEQAISCLEFSKDNNMLVVCRDTQEEQFKSNIEIYDLTHLLNYPKMILKGHTDTIKRITFTEDPNHLISVSVDESLRIWDLKLNKEINKQNCEDRLYGVTYSHKQQLIACCGEKGYAYLFDCGILSNLKLKFKWQAHSDLSLCIEFIGNSTALMTSSKKETRFWQVEDLLKQKFNHFKEIKEGGPTIKAYPIHNPKVIINCSDFKFVNLWNYNSTELIQRIEIPDGLCEQSFVITSDFKKLLTGGKNTMINIFEQQDKK